MRDESSQALICQVMIALSAVSFNTGKGTLTQSIMQCNQYAQFHKTMLDARQTVLLQFKDLHLETLFGIYHTSLLRTVDATWEAFAILCLFLAVANGFLRGHQHVPMLEWALFFTYPCVGLVLQFAFPKAWYRLRELVCVAHRFDVMASTAQPSSFAQKHGLLFAYGMAGMMMNSIGHKVNLLPKHLSLHPDIES